MIFNRLIPCFSNLLHCFEFSVYSDFELTERTGYNILAVNQYLLKKQPIKIIYKGVSNNELQSKVDL